MLLNDLMDAPESHDFGETGYLSLLLVLFGEENFPSVEAGHDPAPGGHIWRRIIKVKVLYHILQVVIIRRVVQRGQDWIVLNSRRRLPSLLLDHRRLMQALAEWPILPILLFLVLRLV